MKIDTISTIAISIGSFLLGGSLGLALSGDCDICGRHITNIFNNASSEDVEEVDFEEKTVEYEEDSLTAVTPTDIDEYQKRASKYYIQESISGADTDGDYVKPFVISRDRYENEYQNFHKESLVYFTKDEVLCDDRDEVVDNIVQVLGPDALNSFGEDSDDVDIVYVRNMRMQCDFEVVREHMSYKENVLGIKDDSEEYINARKFFHLDTDLEE